MTGPYILLLLSLLSCVALHFTRRGSVPELVAAILTLAPVLAIPVGYAMGSFT